MPPRYEISLTITVKDAGAEDVIRMLGPVGDLAARGVIQVDPGTSLALRQLAAIKHADWPSKIRAAKEAMEVSGQDRAIAAERLGISVVTLYTWLAKAREMEA